VHRAGAPRRILLVEDSDDAREMLQVALERQGHTVLAAAGGRDGIELAASQAPVLVLTVLLVRGLALLPPLLAPAPAGSLTIEVTGEQWWWRLRYLPPGGAAVDLANELHLAVGEPVEFRLASRASC